MRSLIVASLLFCILVTQAQVPTPDHVVVVIFENKSYSNFVGNYTLAPYLNSLADDAKGALFTQSYSLIHHSQPNYLILFSGSDQGVTDNDRPSGLPFTTSNLGANLISKGKTFVGYAESMPFAGDDNDDDGLSTPSYARKHNPWVNWQGASSNAISSTLNQPFSSFPTSSNYSSLPTVSFVIPNLTNDMHDGSDWQTAVTVGDTWLQTNLDGYVQWAKTNNSLLIITFDEDNDDATNQIATIFIGEKVKHGQYAETSLQNSMASQTGIDHTNVLRTIEDMYGLPHSAKSGNLNTGTADVDPITDVWTSVVPIQLINFRASVLDEGVNLSWETASETNNDFFTIENSINGIDFNEIDNVKGAGTAHERHNYSYRHKNPLKAKSYYRLVQTDFDKRKTYSEVVTVIIETKAGASIEAYPNPSSGESFQLQVKNFSSPRLNVCIYDLLGHPVDTQFISIPETEGHRIIFIDKQIVHSGIYLLSVSDSQTQVSTKIVVR